jgi:Transposase zinc-binding domain/Putative transposase
MPRPALEVADIFRDHGAAWRDANAGHVSLGQLQVMSAIERCRTAALGGHVAACEDCGHTQIAYNSCRNRHCPKCQGAAARDWLAAREAELLPVPYFHLVFTLPAAIADIAYQNKAVIYDLLFKASSETLLTIAADPKHLGARIGVTAVLHTWGSAMTHHPHLPMIVPGGGFAADGSAWVAAKPSFFLPVRVLSMLFRRLMLTKLAAAHAAGKLQFFGEHRGRPRFLTAREMRCFDLRSSGLAWSRCAWPASRSQRSTTSSAGGPMPRTRRWRGTASSASCGPTTSPWSAPILRPASSVPSAPRTRTPAGPIARAPG